MKDYTAANQAVIKQWIKPLPFTVEQMEQCFKNVQSKKGWKHPINKVIKNPGKKNMACLHEAVSHFTGSPLFVKELPGNKLLVQAPGYYACIGA
jgi:hypothetical protein